MYYRLKSEISKGGSTIEKPPLLFNISGKSLWSKIKGSTGLSWPEVLGIRDLIDPTMFLEELFKKEDKIV